MRTMPMANTGGCLCGGVQYSVASGLRPVIYCHCKQCQKTSGHFVAATAASLENITFQKQQSLCWYNSSDSAQRGFCSVCGSNLFWKPTHGKYMSIFAGTLDQPTGIKAKEHIYIDSAGDYYSIADGLPQHAGYGASVLDTPDQDS